MVHHSKYGEKSIVSDEKKIVKRKMMEKREIKYRSKIRMIKNFQILIFV